MMEIKMITPETKADLLLENEPFEIRGRMIVLRTRDEWQYEVALFDETSLMTFPNEAYDYNELIKNGFCLGAYMDGTCVGLAIMQNDWFKYMFLYDLKVNHQYRKHGIGKKLIEAAYRLAKERDYDGIYTIGQDNNLNACQFYLNSGFVIGGYNTQGYRHTSQEDKADIYFYMD